MLTDLPIIHTNIWDAIWGVPLVLILVLAAKWFLRMPPSWLGTLSTVLALILSIFISHPGDLSAGIFMGLFYSGAVMGIIYTTKQTFLAYRNHG